MITVYKVKYHQATDIRGALFTVTRLDDKKTCRLAYDYRARNASLAAINFAFGADVDKLECVGRLNSSTSLYAINN